MGNVSPAGLCLPADQSCLLGSCGCVLTALRARELHQFVLPGAAMGCSPRAEGSVSVASCDLLWICYWPLSVLPSLVFHLCFLACFIPECLFMTSKIHQSRSSRALCCLLSASQNGQNGEPVEASVTWCTNVLTAAETGTKLAFLSVLLFLQRPGMPSGARMPHQGAPMGPPGPQYVGSPSVRPGMPQTVMETTRKRTAPQQVQQQQVQQQVQQQQQATQNRARRWVFWKENTGEQFEEAKMLPV